MLLSRARSRSPRGRDPEAIGSAAEMRPGRASVSVPLNDNLVETEDGVSQEYRSHASRMEALRKTCVQSDEDKLDDATLQTNRDLYEDLRHSKAHAISNDANYRWARYVAGHTGSDYVHTLYQRHLYETLEDDHEGKRPLVETMDENLAVQFHGPGNTDLRDKGCLCFTPVVVAARDAAFHSILNVVRNYFGPAKYKAHEQAFRTQQSALDKAVLLHLGLKSWSETAEDRKRLCSAFETVRVSDQGGVWLLGQQRKQGVDSERRVKSLLTKALRILSDAEPEERDAIRSDSRLVDQFSMHGLLLHPESCELFAQLTAAKMQGIQQRNPRRYTTTQDVRLLKEEERDIRTALRAWIKSNYAAVPGDDMFANGNPYMKYGMDRWGAVAGAAATATTDDARRRRWL